MLVTLHGRGGFQVSKPLETGTTQDAADGGSRDAEMGGDAAAGPALTAQNDDTGDDGLGCAARAAMRT